MATFQITGPDGATYEITASDEHAAMAAFRKMTGQQNVRQSRREQGFLGKVDAVVRGIADTATFGLMDEFAAGMGAATGIGGTFGDYSGNLARQRGVDKADEADRPWARLAGQVAGGVALPLGAANTVRQGAQIGAGVGAAYGFGSGEGIPDRLTQAGVGGVAGGAIGGALGGVVGRLAPKAPEAVPLGPANMQASDFGVPLTVGQRTGDPALIAREQAMLGGAKGEPAQRIAQAARAEQQESIQDAVRALQERFASQSGTLGRSGDAGAIVGPKIEQAGTAARAAIEAAEQEAARVAAATNAAAESAATRAVGAVGRRANPAGLASEADAAAKARESILAGERSAKQDYQTAYASAFSREGSVDPAFFTGRAPSSAAGPGTSLVAPGSEAAVYAAPLSERVMQRIRQSGEPIREIDNLTPYARRALAQLDKVSSLNLGAVSGSAPAGSQIVGVTLQGIERARRQVLNDISATKGVLSRKDDNAALRAIMTALDDEIEQVMQSALFKGDRGALDAIKQARAKFSQYKSNFTSQGQYDDAGRAMDAIIRGEKTEADVAKYIIGAASVGETGRAVRLFDRIKRALPDNDEAVDAIRGAAWHRLTGGFDASQPASAAKAASEIMQFTRGKGRELAVRLFDPDTLNDLEKLARGLQGFGARTKAEPAKVLPTEDAKILMDIAGRRLPADDVAGAILGFTNRPTAANIKLLDAAKPFLGADEVNALRQAQWMRIASVADGRTPMGAQKLSERVAEFIDGAGRPLAVRLYSPSELNAMRQFAKALKQTVPPAGTANPSNSAFSAAGLARQGTSALAATLGATATGPVGATAGWLAGAGYRAIADNRAAGAASRMFRGELPPTPLGQRLSAASEKTLMLTVRGGRGALGPASEATGQAAIRQLQGVRPSAADGKQEEQGQ